MRLIVKTLTKHKDTGISVGELMRALAKVKALRSRPGRHMMMR